MAKLKDKINELKTKYGITEDAAREVLALHDGDLQESNALLTQEQNKVVEWNKFWFEKAPQIEGLAREYETLKAQMDAIKSATGNQPYQPQPTPTNNQPTNTDDLEQRVYRNFSQVQEDLWNVQKYHFDNFKSIPDLAPIKKLIEERKMTPWAAYKEWVQPMETERKEKELREKITQELTDKMRNEATRNGVNGYLLAKTNINGDEVTSPLDEVLRDKAETPEPVKTAAARGSDPSEFEQLSDFVQSMRSGRSGVAH
jgi:hypothetical protein